MKLLVSILACIILSFGTIAQIKDDAISAPKNLDLFSASRKGTFVLGFNAFIWNPGIKVEGAINQKISLGTHAKAYLFFYNGMRIDPFMRIYFKDSAPEGAFLQLKVSTSFYNRESFFFRGNCYTSTNGNYLCPGDPGYIRPRDMVYMLGGGVAGGYQFVIGKRNRGTVDVYGGLQYLKPNRYHGMEDLAIFFLRRFPIEFGLNLGILR